MNQSIHMERNSLKQDHGINVTRAIINNIGDSNNDKIQIKDSWKKCINQQRYEDQDGYMNDGFSWPPRCYTCSFCKREFRSAQALGGHMNVHRKDRARLRSHYSPPSPTLVDSHDHGQYTTATTTTTILNLNLKPNPNPNFPPPPPPPSSSSTSPFPSSLPSLISPPQPPPPRIFSVPSKACHSDQKWVNVDGHALFDPPPFPLNLKPKWDLNNKMKINAQSLCGVGVGVGDQCDGFRSQEDHLHQHGCNMTTLNKAAAEINVRLDLEIGVLGDSKEDLDLELRLGSYTPA